MSKLKYPLRNDPLFMRLTVIGNDARRVTSYDGPYGAIFATAAHSLTNGRTIEDFAKSHKKLLGWSPFGSPFTEEELTTFSLSDVALALGLGITDDEGLIKKIASYGFKFEDYAPDHEIGCHLNPNRLEKPYDAAVMIDLRSQEIALMCHDGEKPNGEERAYKHLGVLLFVNTPRSCLGDKTISMYS